MELKKAEENQEFFLRSTKIGKRKDKNQKTAKNRRKKNNEQKNQRNTQEKSKK